MSSTLNATAMKTLILLLLTFLPCGDIGEEAPKFRFKPHYEWKQLVTNAPWAKSYNFQLFSLRDTLWVFHPDGTWFSDNGVRWSKSRLGNAISNLAFLDYVPFGRGITGLGHFEGNIEKYRWQNTIYNTTDMRTWTVSARKSNLPERFFYHPFVFQNKIWIIGGENLSTKFGDIWNSPDGIQWKRVADSTPFGPRSHSQVVHLNGKLYLLNHDVWSSTDGIHWQQECKEIVKGQEIFGYNAVVMDGRIWLIGCNRSGRFESKVLSSSDGRNWYATEAPWSPRGGVAACEHKGAVYITGGKYGGQDIDHPQFEYSNDVWVMQRQQTAKN